VHYHFFQSEDDNLLELLRFKITRKIRTNYKKNTKRILNFVKDLNPNIIHMIGAENPYYGESALSLPKEIPLIVSLQTLMNDPNFKNNYPISVDSYNYRAGLEKNIILRADYIGSKIIPFREYISTNISLTKCFLDMALAVGEEILIKDYKKSYEFVYSAADNSKAADYAIEAFAIAKKSNPNISLHVVGGYSDSYLNQLKSRMHELGLGEDVDFTGRLQTHDDVINEIRKARFAILPLKVDLIAGTIREAMANGWPVVSTITPATPELNNKRESILLSEKGDFYAMAENMCKLLSDDSYADMVRQNAAITMNERYSNQVAMEEWRKHYFEILAKYERK
jgi:glycosyltransferase involved in cell wall biosynthesis